MNFDRIPAGRDPPNEINVVVEIPMGGASVKYELDRDSGLLFVDRFLNTAMFYPANYGFIPKTVSGDGNPCDVLVITQVPILAKSVIRCRPVGALILEDEAGPDEKILAVPVDNLHSFYENIKGYEELPRRLLDLEGCVAASADG